MLTPDIIILREIMHYFIKQFILLSFKSCYVLESLTFSTFCRINNKYSENIFDLNEITFFPQQGKNVTSIPETPYLKSINAVKDSKT